MGVCLTFSGHLHRSVSPKYFPHKFCGSSLPSNSHLAFAVRGVELTPGEREPRGGGESGLAIRGLSEAAASVFPVGGEMAQKLSAPGRALQLLCKLGRHHRL